MPPITYNKPLLKSIIVCSFMIASLQLWSQSSNTPSKTDTTGEAYEKERFERELRELLGIKDKPKKEDSFITQVKYLIESGTKNFQNIINKGSLKVSNGDSIYNSIYKIDAAGETSVAKDRYGYISYNTVLRTDENKNDAMTYATQILDKLKSQLDPDYIVEKLDLGGGAGSQSFIIKKIKNKNGVDLILSLYAIGVKYNTEFTVRKVVSFPG